tara:strand:- start:1722 stop:1871 length:150 start_codon:yes stop_codon:yes gene_type:complete
MQNVEVQALSITEDVKMTRVFLVTQFNFFETNHELDQIIDDNNPEDLEA